MNNNFVEGAEKSLSCIFAVEGLALSKREASLFEEVNPFGFILFKRNCDNPEQVRILVDALKESVGRDCPILIDQEGGRVARLKPPHWAERNPMRFYGEMYERIGSESAREALRSDMKDLARELTGLGINVNCAPVLDLLFDGAHDIIGDRSFSGDPAVVADLGAVVCETFLEAGVTPIIKHIPGHGRALSDSHKALPRVKGVVWNELVELDFAPFKALSSGVMGRQIWAMTAHMTYDAFAGAGDVGDVSGDSGVGADGDVGDVNGDSGVGADGVGDLPISLSAVAIEKVIRKEIGFDGVLICDDLDMKALDSYGSSVAEKAVKALAAGCDLALYCDGKFDVMEELAAELPQMNSKTLIRLGVGIGGDCGV